MGMQDDDISSIDAVLVQEYWTKNKDTRLIDADAKVTQKKTQLRTIDRLFHNNPKHAKDVFFAFQKCKKEKLWVSKLISIKPNGHQDSTFHEGSYHPLARREGRAFLPPQESWDRVSSVLVENKEKITGLGLS